MERPKNKKEFSSKWGKVQRMIYIPKEVDLFLAKQPNASYFVVKKITSSKEFKKYENS